MKGKAIIPLVLGLAIGGFAVRHFIKVLKDAKADTGDTVQVVRARMDITPTLEITESMVELATVPTALVPRAVFNDVKEVVGRVTTQNIPQGTAVIPAWLAPRGTPPGLSARIPDGYRAVAVKVDEEQSVAGWIRPGARVDVVALMSTQRGSDRSNISRVILDNVEVLAVGGDIGNSGETGASVAKSVTLMVKPEGATKLHLATSRGKLRLVLRGQTDEGEGMESTSTEDDLLNIMAAAPPVPPLMQTLLKEPKMPAPATDKEAGAKKAPEWTVEVLAGSMTSKDRRKYDVVFQGNGADARRLSQSAGPAGRTAGSSVAVRRPPPPLNLSDDEPASGPTFD